MFKSSVLVTGRRMVLASASRPSPAALRNSKFAPALTQNFSATRLALEKDDRQAATTAAPEGESGGHEGSFARTDDSVRVEYPAEKDFPKSLHVQGRGGLHFKRTLASFSMEGKVGVVTGGARGLGLVMSQALVISGADVAIVDLNRE